MISYFLIRETQRHCPDWGMQHHCSVVRYMVNLDQKSSHLPRDEMICVVVRKPHRKCDAARNWSCLQSTNRKFDSTTLHAVDDVLVFVEFASGSPFVFISMTQQSQRSRDPIWGLPAKNPRQFHKRSAEMVIHVLGSFSVTAHWYEVDCVYVAAHKKARLRASQAEKLGKF